MNDEIIVDLYLQKNQKAISESAALYGAKLKRISFNIVQNMSDAEECENDTYLSAWNSIPPHSQKRYVNMNTQSTPVTNDVPDEETQGLITDSTLKICQCGMVFATDIAGINRRLPDWFMKILVSDVLKNR